MRESSIKGHTDDEDTGASHIREGCQRCYCSAWRDLVNQYKYLQGGCKEDGASGAQCQDQRQWAQVKHRKVCLNTVLTVKVTEPWHRVPREVVKSLFSEIETHVDMIAGN